MDIMNKPSAKETLAFLKGLNPKPKVAKTSLRVPRPCFHPNGGILSISGSKIKVVPIDKTDNVDKNYQPSKVLSDPAHVAIDQLDEQFGNMNLHDSKMDFESVKLNHRDGGIYQE